MAEEQLPWDQQTDRFINQIDASVIGSKYNLKVRDVLMHPENYAKKQDQLDTIKKMRDEISNYFQTMLQGFSAEQARLDGEMQRVDAIYKKIDSLVKTAAKSGTLPILKPTYIARDTNREEAIVIDEYQDSIAELITKLSKSSNFIADFSVPYKNYMMGIWFFSGQKSYMISVNPPTSVIIGIENSSNFVLNGLDALVKA